MKTYRKRKLLRTIFEQSSLRKLIHLPSSTYYFLTMFNKKTNMNTAEIMVGHRKLYLVASPITWSRLKIESSCLAPNDSIYLMTPSEMRKSRQLEKRYERQMKRAMSK